VYAVMKLRIPQNAGLSRLVEDVLASQKELCSMNFVSYLVNNNIKVNFNRQGKTLVNKANKGLHILIYQFQ
jgi:hypothetical protein